MTGHIAMQKIILLSVNTRLYSAPLTLRQVSIQESKLSHFLCTDPFSSSLRLFTQSLKKKTLSEGTDVATVHSLNLITIVSL